MLTTQEADQYIRLTLKQWGLSHLSVKWFKSERAWGRADVRGNVLELNVEILQRFSLFEEVLKHEIAHFLDINERMEIYGTYKKNGRNVFHGKNWKKWCAIVKVKPRRFIPA